MLRKVFILILVFSLSPYVQAVLESAKAAYEAGDYDTAPELIIPLAEAGDARAQHNLGYLYQTGFGVKQDYAEALKWYRKAAEQGLARAQANLGFRYQNGSGVQQDLIQSYAWYGIAAAGGFVQAQNGRDRIGAMLNATELEEAHELAKELWEKYGNKSKN